MKNNLSKTKGSIVKGLALAFGLSSFVMFTACGDDSSSSSSPEENEGEELSLTGAVFGSDYKTGELRWIDKDGKISEKSLSFHQDSKVLVDGADLYVLERMGADNISLVAPEKLDSDGEKAVVWQVSLDDGANPVDMEFDGENAWVALQNADSLVKISTADGKVVKSIKTGKFLQWGGYRRAKNLLTSELSKRGIYATSGQKTVIELLLDKKMSTNREYYSLRVHNGKITIMGVTQAALINGVKTLVAALDHSKGNRLQNCFVIDWPDFGYRGVMLDIARNFVVGPSEMKRFIDLLAYYKINVIQFHFTDDEGWRLEIPGFPELTQVASRRGATLDEKGYLAQIFDGNGNPDDPTQCANGYYTRSEFVEMLRYAW